MRPSFVYKTIMVVACLAYVATILYGLYLYLTEKGLI